MEVSVSVCLRVCVRELVVCRGLCMLCMLCLFSRAVTEPHTLLQLHTAMQKHTHIYIYMRPRTRLLGTQAHAHERVHFNSCFQRRRVNAGLIYFYFPA